AAELRSGVHSEVRRGLSDSRREIPGDVDPLPSRRRGRARRIDAARRHTPQRRRRAPGGSARHAHTVATAEVKLSYNLRMRNVVLGLGISFDGYIARPDGAVDFAVMPKDYSMAFLRHHRHLHHGPQNPGCRP